MISRPCENAAKWPKWRARICKVPKIFAFPCQAIVEKNGEGWAAYCLQTGGFALADTFATAVELLIEQTGLHLDSELADGRDPFSAAPDEEQVMRWFALQRGIEVIPLDKAGIAEAAATDDAKALMFAVRFEEAEDHLSLVDSAIFQTPGPSFKSVA